MFDICVKVLQVIRVQRKAVTAIFAFCMLVNALIPSGMRVFNAVQANARQAFENTRAVNGLFSASSVPLETLKDLLTRSNHINTGYSPRSGADPDKDKDTSSSYFLNGFTGAARLFASFNLCPWLVPWAMASGYGWFPKGGLPGPLAPRQWCLCLFIAAFIFSAAFKEERCACCCSAFP